MLLTTTGASWRQRIEAGVEAPRPSTAAHALGIPEFAEAREGGGVGVREG